MNLQARSRPQPLATLKYNKKKLVIKTLTTNKPSHIQGLYRIGVELICSSVWEN